MKKFGKLITMLLLAALVLSGCGKAGDGGEKAPVETTDQAAKTSAAQTETAGDSGAAGETEEPSETDGSAGETAAAKKTSEETAAETLTPDPTNLTYLEEYQIADFYGDGKEYALYAPKGGENADGFFYFWDHGVTFTASVFNCGDPEVAEGALQMYLQESIDLQVKDWRENPDYSEVGVGEILEKGDDRYLFVTAKAKDPYDTPYQRTKLIYMSVRDGGAAVFWDMEVSEREQDEETAPLLQEVARCYGLNLKELAMEDGAWEDQNAQREADQQDVYEPGEGEPVLEKVEGYQYLGMLTLTLDEEGAVTCPVLVPMGWNTTAAENRVSTAIHGVSVRASGNYTVSTMNFQTMVQREAAWDLEYYSDPEEGNRNVRSTEVMPMQGQEAGVYYILEYEEQDHNSKDYYKRADITCMILVEEKYYVTCRISLKSVDYDRTTNSLIRELETAYGLDLSAWYADEEVQ